MLAKLLLLLAAASAFGRGNTMATATSAVDCEDNTNNNNNNNNNRFDGCNNINNNDNVILTLQEQQQQQHQQQRQHQRDTQRQQQQQRIAQIRPKSQQQQEQEQIEPQQHEEKPQFEPFDFANLRRLQQINEYYEDNSNIINNNSNKPKQQQRKRDQDSTYSSVSNNNHYGKDSDNNGNNYFYKHDSNNNNNGNPSSSNSNSRSHSHNYSRTPSPPPPDASNDFRLQLSSALNVGSSRSGSNTGTHVANTQHNNNNNNNHEDDSNDSGDNGRHQQQPPRQHRHSVAVRDKSFAEVDHTSAAVPFGMDEYYAADAQEQDEPNEMADDDELGMQLPYGIQNVRKRTIRGSPPSEHRGKSTTYQSLCPTKRVSIPLETVGYEYRPNHYIEVTCAHNYAPTHNYDFNKNKICSEAGFSCIQLNRTIHLIRRNKAAIEECWESEIRIVPSGCECMWPKHSYGDIIAYHEAQKRYSAQANTNTNANANERPANGGGVSSLPAYLQIPRQVELIGLDGQRREETEGIGFEAYEFN